MTVPQYSRAYSFIGDIFEITQINVPYLSNIASGYIGLRPYTAIDPSQSSTQSVQLTENFLYHLTEENHITYQIISVFLNRENQDESFVKFGGYDPEGF